MLASEVLDAGEAVECAVDGCNVEGCEFGVEGGGAEEGCHVVVRVGGAEGG